jgi:peptide/nickel transport system permease protein
MSSNQSPAAASNPTALGSGSLAGQPVRTVRSRSRSRPTARGLAGAASGNLRITLGLAVLILVALVALLAPYIAPQDPEAQYAHLRLAPPGSTFILGGDNLGRDVLSRLMYAGRVSLVVGLVSMAIAVVMGVVVGAASGFFGGWVDRGLMRTTDLVNVFPTFFLLILAAATFGRSMTLLILAIGLTAWTTNARVVRALVLKHRNQDFITAARVVGIGDFRIIVRHLLPLLIPIIIASATIRVAGNILVESGLSYIGLGIAEPTASWGNMVSSGVSYFRHAWWLVAFPGAAVFVVVLAFNLLGEGLRDALDPQARRR